MTVTVVRVFIFSILPLLVSLEVVFLASSAIFSSPTLLPNRSVGRQVILFSWKWASLIWLLVAWGSWPWDGVTASARPQ